MMTSDSDHPPAEMANPSQQIPPNATEPTVLGQRWQTIKLALMKIPTQIFISLILVNIALANLVIGIRSFSTDCHFLPWYCVLISLLCMIVAVVTLIHYRLNERFTRPCHHFFHVTLIGRIVRAIGFLFGLGLVFLSCVVIEQLSENTCPFQRSVRQMVLADIIPILTMASTAFLYFFLRVHFPELRFSSMNKQWGKFVLLCLCLAALISCLVNLGSHSMAWKESYHYGFSSRSEPCPHGCDAASTWTLERYNNANRTVGCYDSSGRPVSLSVCQQFIPDEYPYHHPALSPCPQVNCTYSPYYPDQKIWLRHWEFRENTYSVDRTACFPYPNHQYVTYMSCEDNIEHRHPTNRTNYLGPIMKYDIGGIPEELIESGNVTSGCSSLPLPPPYSTQWDTTSMDLLFDLPPADCPQECIQLGESAIVFTIVFSLMSLVLTCSLCAPRRPRNQSRSHQSNGAAEFSSNATHSASDGTTAAIALEMSSAVDSSDHAAAVVHPNPDLNSLSGSHLSTTDATSTTILPSVTDPTAVGATSAAATLPSFAWPRNELPPPPPNAPIARQCGYAFVECITYCSICGILAVYLFHALRLMICRGTDVVRPFWRHGLIAIGCLLLSAFSLLSFINLLHLVNATCRDFMVSCIMSASVCFLLTGMTVHLLWIHKAEVLTAERNPFETLGLLRNTDDEDEDELTTDADEERKEETQFRNRTGAASDSQPIEEL